jgi:hypothetical protein
MKRAMFSLLAVVIVAGMTGCVTQHGKRPWACMGGSCAQAPENCQSCSEPCDSSNDPNSCRECKGRGCHLCHRGEAGGLEVADGAAAGPATGAVTYPYYTTRGPRDFLAKNPQSIGP